jgi:hypothetical protein
MALIDVVREAYDQNVHISRDELIDRQWIQMTRVCNRMDFDDFTIDRCQKIARDLLRFLSRELRRYICSRASSTNSGRVICNMMFMLEAIFDHMIDELHRTDIVAALWRRIGAKIKMRYYIALQTSRNEYARENIATYHYVVFHIDRIVYEFAKT